MTLFSTSKPAIIVKALLKYPARVFAGTGLKAESNNGNLTFSFDYSSLPFSSTITSPENYTTLVYNGVLERYEEARLDSIPTKIANDPRTTAGDVDYVMPTATRYLALTASLTNDRTWTLPAASAVPGGVAIRVFDEAGGISSTNTLTIAAAGTNDINGEASITLTVPYSGVAFVSNGIDGYFYAKIVLPISDLSGLGTGVATALAKNTGTNGAVALYNGDLGTPSNVNLSQAINLPVTAITGLGTNVSDSLATNVNANGGFLRLTGDLGSGVQGGLSAGVNTANGFVRLLSSGAIPTLDGSNLYNLPTGTAGTTPINAVTGLGTNVGAALQIAVGSAGSITVNGGALGTPSSGNLQYCTNYTAQNLGGLGTGVGTALGVNVGSSGAFITNGGAAGTPSSINLSNATNMPLSAVTGLGSGVSTALAATPNSTGGIATIDGSNRLPSVDGSQLTNITSANVATGFTAGSITFAGASGVFSQNNTKLFWDNTNYRVGINTATPAVSIAVSATDAVLLPVGTTAQRPTGAKGYIRYNDTTSSFEGYNGSAWGSIGGGATGGVGNSAFYENDTNITADYTITSGKNAGTFGPVQINSGISVTVPTGSVWTIV